MPTPEHHLTISWLTVGVAIGTGLVIRFAWKFALYRAAKAAHLATRALLPLTRKARWSALKALVAAAAGIVALYLLLTVVSVMDLQRAGEARPSPSPTGRR